MAGLTTAVLSAYAQVLFADHRGVGALLVLASALSPRAGLHGLAAVLAGHGLVRLLRFSEAAASRGRYGYNPLLVGLAVGTYFEPGLGTAALLLLSVVAVVFLEAALESALGAVFYLPLLSLPFVLVTWLSLAAAPYVGIVARAAPELIPPHGPAWLPDVIDLYLRSLGAIFFSPTVLAGSPGAGRAGPPQPDRLPPERAWLCRGARPLDMGRSPSPAIGR